MLRVRQVKVLLGGDILSSLVKKLKTAKDNVISYEILKESIDSRKDLYLIYELKVELKNESLIKLDNDITLYIDNKYSYTPKGDIKIKRPIVVGSGPAGLFSAYLLSLNGYKPIIIERGSDIDKRTKDVDKFINEGILDTNSNVQFGLGGAGTFSDGKLNTMIKDKELRGKFVLETFHEFGAPDSILYKSHPHIGTDLLKQVISNMKDEIIKLGGEFRFNTCLNDIVIENNKIAKVLIGDEYLDTDILILAIGHSARDTFYMLNKYLAMEAKPFAVGIRISHPQEMIDVCQYGRSYKKLGAASYKLTYQTKKGRGVYTFCMCPGGYVLASQSDNNTIVTNGMSNNLRDNENSNSAVLVDVKPSDYDNGSPLDGIDYQEKYEKLAFSLSNDYRAPSNLLKEFLNDEIATSERSIKTSYPHGLYFCDLNKCLPDYVVSNLKYGIKEFDKKLKGFNNPDAILIGIESRSSSPVRILRDEFRISSEKFIYPIGEGAGYAGGITSSAVDGLKTAISIINEK